MLYAIADDQRLPRCRDDRVADHQHAVIAAGRTSTMIDEPSVRRFERGGHLFAGGQVDSHVAPPDSHIAA